MSMKVAVACLLFCAAVTSYATEASKDCPPLQSTSRVQGVNEVIKPCIREARKGNAAASWTLAVVSRYMVCEETKESRRIANLWQDAALKAGNPDAIFESAMLELYSLGNSIEEEEIESIKRIADKLSLAAKVGHPDANFQLYRLHNMFRYANPSVAELGSYADAVSRLLRAVDLGSYMAAEELAAAYLSAKQTQQTPSTETGGEQREFQYDALVDELGRRGLLPSNLAEGAELNLIKAASTGRWEAMEGLEDGYERGTFGRADPIRALAWVIIRRLDGDSSAQISRIEKARVASLCERLREITGRGRIFDYHRPNWSALESSNVALRDCVVAPAVPSGGFCIHANQLVEP